MNVITKEECERRERKIDGTGPPGFEHSKMKETALRLSELH